MCVCVCVCVSSLTYYNRNYFIWQEELLNKDYKPENGAELQEIKKNKTNKDADCQKQNDPGYGTMDPVMETKK